jgi:hypothetical protein
MAGIRIEPSAATSATAEPEISAKNSEVPMFTMARPPRTNPSSAEAKAISRRDRPEEFMIAPAKMNSGIANKGKLVAPSNMTRATLGSMAGPCVSTMASIATSPRATAMGTLRRIRANRPTTIRARIIEPPRRPLPGFRRANHATGAGR